MRRPIGLLVADSATSSLEVASLGVVLDQLQRPIEGGTRLVGAMKAEQEFTARGMK